VSFAAASVLALVITASGDASALARADNGDSAAATSALREARVATAAAYRGRNRQVDPTSRPAVPGKHLAVVSLGEASISIKIPTDAAVDAAHTLGWKVEVYDAGLNTANDAPLVRQAIAADVDAILLVGIDCQAVKQPLEEAKAAGIAIFGVDAFDCNDPHAGGAPKRVFSAAFKLGPQTRSLSAWVQSFGVDQANYIIAKSNNRAKVIDITDPEITAVYYANQGFIKTIAHSHGANVVETVDITVADLTNNRVVPLIQAALQRHPDADWIRSPYTYLTTLGVVPALGGNPGKVRILGSEGYEPELDLVRDGRVAAAQVIQGDWLAWAGVDTLNSAFRHEAPADSGVGWVIVDKAHNLPPSGSYRSTPDFRKQYRRVWGVG
jgi:ribose transport system substrate-binding protein